MKRSDRTEREIWHRAVAGRACRRWTVPAQSIQLAAAFELCGHGSGDVGFALAWGFVEFLASATQRSSALVPVLTIAAINFGDRT